MENGRIFVLYRGKKYAKLQKHGDYCLFIRPYPDISGQNRAISDKIWSLELDFDVNCDIIKNT